MFSFTRWLAVLTVIAAGFLVLPSRATAADPGRFIQINNGFGIVTNPGQQVQVVVQFGNRGTTTLTDVMIRCLYVTNSFDIVQAYPGPFPNHFIFNNVGGDCRTRSVFPPRRRG